LHHTTAARSGILPPAVALKVRHPSSSFPRAPTLQPLFAVTDRGCFLELGVRRLCLLSRASVAVCLLFTFAFFAVHRSRSLGVHRSSSHSRSSGSHVALIQTLRLTRALHLAVELLSFVVILFCLAIIEREAIEMASYLWRKYADYLYTKWEKTFLWDMVAPYRRPKSFTPLVTIYIAAFYTGVVGAAITEQLHKEKYWEEHPGRVVPLMEPKFYWGPWRIMRGDVPSPPPSQ
ncbi:hypothetical protein S245_069899, partial [Arachis hypogaea]